MTSPKSNNLKGIIVAIGLYLIGFGIISNKANDTTWENIMLFSGYLIIIIAAMLSAAIAWKIIKNPRV